MPRLVKVSNYDVVILYIIMWIQCNTVISSFWISVMLLIIYALGWRIAGNNNLHSLLLVSLSLSLSLSVDNIFKLKCTKLIERISFHELLHSSFRNSHTFDIALQYLRFYSIKLNKHLDDVWSALANFHTNSVYKVA